MSDQEPLPKTDAGCGSGTGDNCNCQSRRDFFKLGGLAASAAAATIAALSPLRELDEFPSLDEFLQKHYHQMTPKEMEQVLERIRQKVGKKYAVKAEVSDPQPISGVEFAYALNLSTCTGCRRCVHACVEENNQSRQPHQMEYIRVLKMRNDTFNLDTADHHYADDEAPEEGFTYMPVQCMQCADPPCVKVCPVNATWQDADGIVVIDYDWCIGCRYCMVACPYQARHFNYAAPQIATEDVNPDMGYLSNRPRRAGVVEKCHFCLHKARRGEQPACVEVCPVGARVFGNVLDSESEISYILRHKRIYVLKEELGTNPRFYYYFDE